MSEEKTVHIYPGSGVAEIILREGEALKLHPPKSIIIKGILEAPHQFLQGKDFDEKQCHLLIKKNLGSLELHVNDTDAVSESIITGSLQYDDDLLKFKINSDQRWSVQAFFKFVKTMRYYFDDKDQHSTLLASLTKWSVSVEKVIKEHTETSGHTLLSLENKITQEPLQRIFTLNMPLFQGYEKYKFNVEIGLDPRNTTVELYLISDELLELGMKVREQLISAELKKFEVYNFSKVVVS